MTEMVALALGARLAEKSGVVVHSDCAAALATLRLRQARKVKTLPYWQLGMLLDLDAAVKAEKVRAHPERHMVKIETLDDRGITAADLFAGSSKFATLVVSSQEVLQMLISFSGVALVHLDTHEVVVGNLNDMRVEYERVGYLARRDAARVIAGRPPRWAGCNTKLGAYTTGAGKVGLGAQGCATRIQYDWHYWGSNRAKANTATPEDALCPLCLGAVEDQCHVLTACTHKERAITRGRAWGDLGLFLELVERGEVPSALEEAQVAARADPRKEKARAKRIEERNRVFEMRDMDAFLRLSKAGYMLRKTHQAKKVEERKHKTAAQKADAIRVVRQLFALMMSHQDGWTLMIGMPSSKLLKDIVEMKGSDAPMMSSMSAEVRRFQRAVGMTTWEIITGHNRGLLPLDLTREGALRS